MYYIWIVCDNRCKDVYLPDQGNWTGEIALGQNDTGWDSDVRIPIRTLDNNCYVSCAKGFTWEKRQKKHSEVEIHDQLALVMTKDKMRIGLVFSQCDIQDTVFKKYLVPNNSKIEIGRNPNCAICFSDSSVSGVHGILEIKEGICQYTDSSSFGSYVNGIRLKGYCQLHFGDVITLASGIKIVYLQSVIAINNQQKLAHSKLSPAKLTPQTPQSRRCRHPYRSGLAPRASSPPHGIRRNEAS